jgi:hypothetical protein
MGPTGLVFVCAAGLVPINSTSVEQGGPWGKQNVFGQLRKFLCDLSPPAFLNPCYETPKNAIKQIEQNNRGRKRKQNAKRREKATFFVMSPGTFLQHSFIVFF